MVTAQATVVEALSPDCIEIRVSNCGVEIPSEELPRIFDPFYRILGKNLWKNGGTGLGLALVRKLVNQLQGKIEVTSGQGWTTFTIVLPNLGLPAQEVGDDCD